MSQKELVLIRHAKSDWSDGSLKDFDRPLNARGRRVAPKMGKKLFENEELPELILTSPAARALSTTEYISEQLPIDASKIVHTPDIYEASVRTLLSIINTIDDQYNRVFMVGHNPGFSYLAEYLSGEEIRNVPTCGVVKINLTVDSWQEVSQNLGTLNYFIYPKQFDF